MADKYPKFEIQYCKIPTLNLEHLEKQFIATSDEFEHDYNPFQIQTIQNYNPAYSRFFDLSRVDCSQISLNHKYHIHSLDTVHNNENIDSPLSKNVFIKFAPLLDPIRYMIGKYDTNDNSIRTLPSPQLLSDDEYVIPHPKIANPNNSAYIDNFFSFLSGQMLHHHNIVHCVDYYGSVVGVQNKFKMNVSDDIEYLNSSAYFTKNVDHLYSITATGMDEFANFGSRNHKHRLCISQSNTLSEIELGIEIMVDDISTGESGDLVIVDSTESIPVITNELIYENNNIDKHNKSPTTSNSSNNSENNYSITSDADSENNNDDDDWETEDEDGDENENEEERSESSEENFEDDDEEFQYAFIRNFPVQLICLEKCDGTLDQLFSKKLMDIDNSASALFQIIMILLIYQKTFHFTHNDLHTNNIMYSETDVDYLYYRFNRVTYKVPTYGKIFKLIDFGRSIYRYRGQIFCSDSFGIGGDAATQYNCEPYFNESKPRIEPNYSFDLCRLGCSIYDFIIDIDESEQELNDIQKLIQLWCTDDNDKNILYKKNGDERYPNFKLYKMIARNVHRHMPEDQLKHGIFKQFLLDNNDEDENLTNIIDVDKLPCYA